MTSLLTLHARISPYRAIVRIRHSCLRLRSQSHLQLRMASQITPPASGVPSEPAKSSILAASISPHKIQPKTSLSISKAEDDAEVRAKYRRSFLNGWEIIDNSTVDAALRAPADWITELELDAVEATARAHYASGGTRLKVMVLYGSLRKRLVTSVMMLQWLSVGGSCLICFEQVLFAPHGNGSSTHSPSTRLRRPRLRPLRPPHPRFRPRHASSGARAAGALALV